MHERTLSDEKLIICASRSPTGATSVAFIACRKATKAGNSQPDHLTAAEIVRVVRVAAGLGFRKFRLTGRRTACARRPARTLRAAWRPFPGVESIGLSTNGMKLAALAQTSARGRHPHGQRQSRRARPGNLSPDHRGRRGQASLAGIHAAVAAGFERVKLNCVLMRGVNEEELWPLVLFAAEHGLPLRLIELMPLTTSGSVDGKKFPALRRGDAPAGAKGRTGSPTRPPLGHGPARYYLLKQTGAAGGLHRRHDQRAFLRAVQQDAPDRRRQNPPCLGNHGELDLRAALRQSAGDAAVRELFEPRFGSSPRSTNSAINTSPCPSPMTAIGG